MAATAQLIAMKKRHADKRIAFRLVHGSPSPRVVPRNGAPVDIEQAVTPISQHGAAPPAPDEAQLMNERCRERQEAVESRVDNRVDLSPHVRGSSYNQRDDGLTVRIDLADHHSPCAR